ncbi:hypothetical protein Tco_0926497 [Tanacetum coccineum]|uniref:Uncharacterized protein n=1 Tax=Tanacetum coccineum TaxID=301880 RepID=A0ABQ5DBY6_9ASTR
MKFMYVEKARKILIALSLATGARFYHDLCLHVIDDQIKHYCLMITMPAKGGSSSIFTFFNLPAGAELVLEAEELLLPQAGAEEESGSAPSSASLVEEVGFY